MQPCVGSFSWKGKVPYKKTNNKKDLLQVIIYYEVNATKLFNQEKKEFSKFLNCRNYNKVLGKICGETI